MRRRGLAALLLCALVAALFPDTIASIVGQWNSSDTFAHGWFVLPIAAWLVWDRRDRLAAPICSRSDARLFVPLAGFGIAWLLGRLAGVQVVEQLAFVLLLITLAALALGPELTRRLRFPLVFLVFLAPVGAELVPLLMELTADVTVAAIRASGVPIHRDGLYFSIPSGNWSVVEACSGIRYLIASIMLGTLYSGVFLTGTRWRLAFLVLAVVVPILANWARAYGIVMLGHLSSNRLATGADHLVYGWVFFGVVMFILFAIGARFPGQRTARGGSRVIAADAAPGAPSRVASVTTADECAPALTQGIKRWAVPAVVAGLMAAAFPAYALAIERGGSALDLRAAHVATLFTEPDSGRQPGPLSRWQPAYSGYVTHRHVDTLADAGNATRVAAHAFVYGAQRQGAELIASGNRIAADDRWRLSESRRVSEMVSVDGQTIDIQVERSVLADGAQRLLVWRWNAIRGVHDADPLAGKLRELIGRLRLDERTSTGYVLAVDEASPGAEDALRAVAARLISSAQLNAQGERDARAAPLVTVGIVELRRIG